MGCRRAFIFGLFDFFQVGRTTTVGTDNLRVVGAFSQIIDGVVLLTGASIFNNSGALIQVVPVARIPLNQVTFVS
ncbi:MAG: hypothetical protein M0Z55_05425 [Peptococcaceae bacterium]|nr:hypothetical protein [Peptococcaceae bacterium]